VQEAQRTARPLDSAEQRTFASQNLQKDVFRVQVTVAQRFAAISCGGTRRFRFGAWTAFLIGVDSRNKITRGGEMKIQNIFRTQVAVMAVGAALLFAGAASAQEIDNPSFDEGSNSTPFSQKADATKANPTKSAAADRSAENRASKGEAKPAPNAIVSENAVVQDGVVSSPPPLEFWMSIAAFFTVVMGLLYVRSEKRRRLANLNEQHAVRVRRTAAHS
jgi:hypothetical protein